MLVTVNNLYICNLQYYGKINKFSRNTIYII